MTPAPLRHRLAWVALEAHHQRLDGMQRRRLFAEDPGRGERMAIESAGVFLDYSKLGHDGSTNNLIRRYRRMKGSA